MPADLHRRAVVADTHNDLLMAVAARPPARWAGFFRDRWLPQLRDGGVDLQVLPVFIDEAFRPEGALRETLRMVEAAHVLAEGNADEVSLCRDGEEIDRALADGQIALVLALESARHRRERGAVLDLPPAGRAGGLDRALGTYSTGRRQR